jgi:anti-sigma regulatory factor (Ser/Thr protein kinase)
MPYGHQRAPVRPWIQRLGQPPLSTTPLEQLQDQVLPGALRPEARWACREVAASDLDTGLACRAAREFTGQTLHGWGLPDVADDAAVIVSELVTNALQHGLRNLTGAAHDQVELYWWRLAAQIICMVTDPGAEPPVMVQPDPLSEAGRGLHVVDALSATWGWTRLGACRKAVWATLPVPRADAVDGRQSQTV